MQFPCTNATRVQIRGSCSQGSIVLWGLSLALPHARYRYREPGGFSDPHVIHLRLPVPGTSEKREEREISRKVDSANRHGILLDMVQVLTDLDLVISKSYISSDGGWLMDVFHVTDHLGNKLTDPTLIRFIQQSLVAERRGVGPGEVRTCLGKLVGPGHQLASDHTALELTATDRPGLLSEISAVLTELACHVVAVHAWTHNDRAACIAYVADRATGRAITDAARLAHIQDQVDSVVGAHQGPSERRWVRMFGPFPGRVHTERRLHQLMREDRDYEAGPPPPPADADQFAAANIEVRRNGWPSLSSMGMETRASIDSWMERGYSVVNIRSRDRPKLLFDTVCSLTDMQYLVFHAAVSSHGPLAIQEYYIRHMDGCTILDTESERQRVTRCLVAAVERRVSHGLRLDLRTRKRPGLLSDVTRVFRENGLSLTRAECTTRGETAVGTFYVTDAYGGEVDPERMEAVRRDIGGSVNLEIKENPIREGKDPSPSRRNNNVEEERSKFSLGSLLWSRIERFSSNFGSIRS
ncbi:ACT domain-containing protein ACR1 [Cocos nucifera]|uniref:ACT domain-containing protein ACR n=1 Tax=Cocos nucifera TaxID=13894 RepID=A0A8K0I816_COCNU|nr:ACT domain-containing protein ACR1 [Cocos nucifera]